MMGGKIRSSAPSSQIPMLFYQKALTGVFVGAVFQRLRVVSLATACKRGQLGLYYYWYIM